MDSVNVISSAVGNPRYYARGGGGQPNIHFGGTNEILYNLGKALNAAQYQHISAHPSSIAAQERGEGLAKLRAYIDAATNDSEFLSFIENFETYIDRPTKSRPGGSPQDRTLGQIANKTDYFGQDHLNLRAKAFKTFEHNFLHEIRDKLLYGDDPKMTKFRAFLDAIKPSVTDEDQVNKRQKKKFRKRMAERIDYLS